MKFEAMADAGRIVKATLNPQTLEPVDDAGRSKRIKSNVARDLNKRGLFRVRLYQGGGTAIYTGDRFKGGTMARLEWPDRIAESEIAERLRTSFGS